MSKKTNQVHTINSALAENERILTNVKEEIMRVLRVSIKIYSEIKSQNSAKISKAEKDNRLRQAIATASHQIIHTADMW